MMSLGKNSFCKYRYLLFGVISGLLASKNSLAIDNTPGWSLLDFDFHSPGARARSMGGGLVGLANDSSSLFYNPAGMIEMPSPRFVTEFMTNQHEEKRITSPFYGDINIKNSNSSGLSFFSLSVPVKENSFSLFIGYNKVTNIKSKMDLPQFDTSTYLANVALNIDELGAGIAADVFNGKIHLGATLGRMYLDLKHSYLTKNEAVERIRYFGSSSETSLHLGVIFKPKPKFSLGLGFNFMPQFSYSSIYEEVWLSSIEYNKRLTEWLENPFGEPSPLLADSWDEESSFKIPDSYSIGVGYSFRRFTGVAELKYVRYSDLLTKYTTPWGQRLAELKSNQYYIDDTTEIHMGLEYDVSSNFLKFLRFGLYYLPAHSIKFSGLNERDFVLEGNEEFPIFMEELLNGGDDSLHITTGIGTKISKAIELDLAWDYTEQKNTIVLSLAYNIDI